MAANEDERSIFWLRKIDREIEGEPKIKDVCAACYNGWVSNLDAYICSLFDKYFLNIPERFKTVSFEFDYHRLKRWLLKASFNSARLHSSFDLFAFTPLLPYMSGRSLEVGRSVQLYVQLTYPSEIPTEFLAESQPRPYFFRPLGIRLGNIFFEAPGVGRKILRAVHLRSFSFFLAFFESHGGGIVAQDFSREFLNSAPATVLLRENQQRAELVCNGGDAWSSFNGARENRFNS